MEGNPEQLRQILISENPGFQPILPEPAILHQNHPSDFRDYIMEVMGHEDDPGAGLRNLSQHRTERMQ